MVEVGIPRGNLDQLFFQPDIAQIGRAYVDRHGSKVTSPGSDITRHVKTIRRIVGDLANCQLGIKGGTMGTQVIPDGGGNPCHMGAVTVPILDASAAKILHVENVFCQIRVIWIDTGIGNGDNASGTSPATRISMVKAADGEWRCPCSKIPAIMKFGCVVTTWFGVNIRRWRTKKVPVLPLHPIDTKQVRCLINLAAVIIWFGQRFIILGRIILGRIVRKSVVRKCIVRKCITRRRTERRCEIGCHRPTPTTSAGDENSRKQNQSQRRTVMAQPHTQNKTKNGSPDKN